MIGPGWMPSRPRPLPRPRRWLWQYTPGYLRKKRTRRRRSDAPARARTDAWEAEAFDGRRAELPTATLRPRRSEERHRAARRNFAGWLAHRWAWLRPRGVPMLAALAGMLALLGATRYMLAREVRPAACAQGAAAPVELACPQGLETVIRR